MAIDLTKDYLTAEQAAMRLGLTVEDVARLLHATILTGYGPLFATGEVARVKKKMLESLAR